VTVDQLLTVLMALDAAFAVEPRISPEGRARSPASASAELGTDDQETW
jgi:HTH-type transcriptional regulator/antitoxin HipB